MLLFRMIMLPIKKLFHKSPHDGAQTQIMLAVEPELENITGKYFVNCKESDSSEKSKDDETSEWLWTKSLELTGLEIVAQKF